MKKILLFCLFLFSIWKLSFADIDPATISAMVQDDNVTTQSSNSSVVNVIPDSNNAPPASIDPTIRTQSEPSTDTTDNSGLDPSILSLNKNYTIVLFYESTCPHCQRFDPILKQFADTYHFKVYPFTVDGKSLPSFENSYSVQPSILASFFDLTQDGEVLPSFSNADATGVLQSLMAQNRIIVPAAFLIDQNTMKVYLISIGEELMPDLINRMEQISQEVQGEPS